MSSGEHLTPTEARRNEASRIELSVFRILKPHLVPMLDDELGQLRVNLLDAIGAALALDLQEAKAERDALVARARAILTGATPGEWKLSGLADVLSTDEPREEDTP